MAPSSEEISAAFVSGHVTLTADQQRLALATYRLLATGHPASLEAIADEAGWSRGDVEARLGTWPGTIRDDDGAIAGFWGLATEAVTDHRMDVEGPVRPGHGAPTTPCSSPCCSGPRPG